MFSKWSTFCHTFCFYSHFILFIYIMGILGVMIFIPALQLWKQRWQEDSPFISLVKKPDWHGKHSQFFLYCPEGWWIGSKTKRKNWKWKWGRQIKNKNKKRIKVKFIKTNKMFFIFKINNLFEVITWCWLVNRSLFIHVYHNFLKKKKNKDNNSDILFVYKKRL